MMEENEEQDRTLEDWGSYEPEMRKALRFVASLAGRGVAQQVATAIDHEYIARDHPEPAQIESQLTLKRRIKIHPRRMIKAQRLIQQWFTTLSTRKGWLGIAPSYLCSEMNISYEEAATLLKDLEDIGFIYDNGHGNHFRLPDGRTYATRYSMRL